MISIAQDRIGKFTSLAEKRTYDRAISIKSAAESAAKLLRSYDESSHDLNGSSPGYVLLDQVKLDSTTNISGYCQFDPQDGGLERLDSKQQSVYDHMMTEQVVRMEQKPDGSKFYQSQQGSLTIDARGNLLFDPTAGVPSWT